MFISNVFLNVSAADSKNRKGKGKLLQAPQPGRVGRTRGETCGLDIRRLWGRMVKKSYSPKWAWYFCVPGERLVELYHFRMLMCMVIHGGSLWRLLSAPFKVSLFFRWLQRWHQDFASLHWGWSTGLSQSFHFSLGSHFWRSFTQCFLDIWILHILNFSQDNFLVYFYDCIDCV